MPIILKKWITTKLFGTVANDYNDNLTVIEAAVSSLEASAQANASLLDFSSWISDAYAWAAAEPKRLKTGITTSSTTNIPSGNFQYASAVCLYRVGLARVVLISTDGKIAIGVQTSSAWSPWVIHG